PDLLELLLPGLVGVGFALAEQLRELALEFVAERVVVGHGERALQESDGRFALAGAEEDVRAARRAPRDARVLSGELGRAREILGAVGSPALLFGVVLEVGGGREVRDELAECEPDLGVVRPILRAALEDRARFEHLVVRRLAGLERDERVREQIWLTVS